MLKQHIQLLKNDFRIRKYKFEQWFFRWTVDDDGDLTLTIANYFNLTKYKHSVIIRRGRDWKPAAKHYPKHDGTPLASMPSAMVEAVAAVAVEYHSQRAA